MYIHRHTIITHTSPPVPLDSQSRRALPPVLLLLALPSALGVLCRLLGRPVAELARGSWRRPPPSPPNNVPGAFSAVDSQSVVPPAVELPRLTGWH